MAHLRLARRFACLTGLAFGLVPLLGHASASAGAGATVSITSTLNPRDVHVGPGTTVTWQNEDSTRHRPRSTSGPTEFDGDLDPGQSFSYTFTKAGTWSYHDDRNQSDQSYQGTVVVDGP